MKLSLKMSQPAKDGAPFVVLIHGMGSAATAWKPLLPFLSESFNIITVDLPGHGLSPIKKNQAMDPKSIADLVVSEIKREFDVSEFHLIGNSWGGWVALEIAANYGGNVKSVLALAPAGMWMTTFVKRYPGATFLRLLAKSSSPLAPSLLKYEKSREFSFSNVSPQWRQFTYELCLDATIAMSRSVGYFPAWDGMLNKRFDSKIDPSIPISIVFGDSDNTLPAANCQEKLMAPAHANWITFENSGHAPMWDQPAKVAAELFSVAGVR